MLDEVIVHWGDEIGCLPVTQNQGAPEKHGRDHNGQGFSIRMAGGERTGLSPQWSEADPNRWSQRSSGD